MSVSLDNGKVEVKEKNERGLGKNPNIQEWKQFNKMDFYENKTSGCSIVITSYSRNLFMPSKMVEMYKEIATML